MKHPDLPRKLEMTQHKVISKECGEAQIILIDLDWHDDDDDANDVDVDANADNTSFAIQ